jgi:hypothetical protein
VLLRRLTRAEYSNSVADLIPSVAPRGPRYFDPAKGFPERDSTFCISRTDREPIVADLPPDEADHGFDNQGDVLTLPPMLMEKLLPGRGRGPRRRP